MATPTIPGTKTSEIYQMQMQLKIMPKLPQMTPKTNHHLALQTHQDQVHALEEAGGATSHNSKTTTPKSI